MKLGKPVTAAGTVTEKQTRTRNVGQCPTWWPPCRI